MEKTKNVKITTDEKDPKELAKFAAWMAADPKIAIPALVFSHSEAASDQESHELHYNFILDLSVGVGQSWQDLTGDKLPDFRAHLTALVLYADVWSELAAATNMSFNKEAFLSRSFRETAENIGLKGDDGMIAKFMELEAEQARQRLAAIAGTYKA